MVWNGKIVHRGANFDIIYNTPQKEHPKSGQYATRIPELMEKSFRAHFDENPTDLIEIRKPVPTAWSKNGFVVASFDEGALIAFVKAAVDRYYGPVREAPYGLDQEH